MRISIAWASLDRIDSSSSQCSLDVKDGVSIITGAWAMTNAPELQMIEARESSVP